MEINSHFNLAKFIVNIPSDCANIHEKKEITLNNPTLALYFTNGYLNFLKDKYKTAPTHYYIIRNIYMEILQFCRGYLTAYSHLLYLPLEKIERQFFQLISAKELKAYFDLFDDFTEIDGHKIYNDIYRWVIGWKHE